MLIHPSLSDDCFNMLRGGSITLFTLSIKTLYLSNLVFSFAIPPRMSFPSRLELDQRLSSGSPTRNTSTSLNLEPPVPTRDDCKRRLSVDRNKAIFYTGLVQESAQRYADKHGRSYERFSLQCAGE